MVFRKDINSLRALAVLAVVAFHFGPKIVPGGFVGVDVFFVISGFLMTSIILNKIELKNFSVIDFYIARANRIIPALLVLCFVMLIAGWLFFAPLDYKALGKHASSSLMFASNIIYSWESSYFAATAHDKWLLHTWSLSVEWQFYMLWPLILMFLNKIMSIVNIRRCILLFTALSFAFSVYVTFASPSDAYYLLEARVWQMLVGAVAAVYPISMNRTYGKTAEVLGILFIVFSCFYISGDDPWPGYLALLPVLGAFFVIQAQQNSFFANSKLLQHVGRYSYSIYLWHWPFVVLLNAIGYSLLLVILFVSLSFIFGIASYKFIEQSGFLMLKKTRMSTSFISVCVFCIAVVFGAFVYVSGGADIDIRGASKSEKAKFINTYNVKNEQLMKLIQKEYWAQCNYYDVYADIAKIDGIDDGCVSKVEGGILLWGDSHAQALSYGIRYSAKEIGFSQIASSSCAPALGLMEGVGEVKKACDRSNAAAKKAIVSAKPKVIILAQRDGHDQNDYIALAKYIKQKLPKAKVILIGPMPQWRPSLPEAIARRHFDKSKTSIKDPFLLEEITHLDKKLREKYQGNEDLDYLSLINSLCNNDLCLAKVDDNNTPLVWDYGHLTLEGSKFVFDTIIGPKVLHELEN